MSLARTRSLFACCGLFVILGFSLPGAALAVDGEAVARRLLSSQGCKACHPFEGAEESLAPDLTSVGSRLTKEQIRGWLVSVDHRHATGRIADFRHLSNAEIDALVTFLSQRK